MVVLGGDPSIAGVDPAVNTIEPFGCTFSNRNHIAVIFEKAETTAGYASLMLTDFGAMLGLAMTTLRDDCMCRIDAPCNLGVVPDSLCTFGVDVPTSMLLNDGRPANCDRTPTQDEPALLEAALGLR